MLYRKKYTEVVAFCRKEKICGKLEGRDLICLLFSFQPVSSLPTNQLVNSTAVGIFGKVSRVFHLAVTVHIDRSIGKRYSISVPGVTVASVS